MRKQFKSRRSHLHHFKAFLSVAIIIVLCSCDNQRDSSKTTSEQQIGHIVLQVSDLQESQRFYEDILNMRTNEEAIFNGKRRIFLSATESHHELVLKEGLQEKIPTDKRYLQQLAVRLNSREKLAEYYQDLKSRDLNPELKDNQISWSIYFYDPDSVYIELYWDVRNEEFGKQKWRRTQEDLSPEKLLKSENHE